jgi:phosphoglycolate phosphatase
MKSFMKNIKLVAFDLDGTLIDSMPWYAEMATNLLQEHYGLDATYARVEYYRTSGVPFAQQLEKLFPHNAKNKNVAEEFEEQKSNFLLNDGFELSSEVQHALAQLKILSLRIAISTSNTPDNLQALVGHWPVQFDAVLGYEGENFQKGVTHFNFLSDFFDIKPKEILFIGDSLDDYRLAKEAGAGFAAVLGSFLAEDFKTLDPGIACLRDIPNLLEWFV